MLQGALILIAAVHMAVGAPQFVSMKDGKIGVNFGGYHAEAGLGGLLTGNSAHGGLSASAGTPFGQNAGAGLGGVVDGRAAGAAFAGATAGGNVGASAGLGGAVGGDSALGAEAHAGGVSHSVVGQGGGGFQIRKEISLPPPPTVEFQGNFYSQSNAAASANVDIDAESEVGVVQKIKPQKKVIHETSPTNTVVVEKRFEVPAHLEVAAEATPKVETTHHVETVQQVAPVKTTVLTSAVAEQPAFNFQKGFDFNFQLGGGAQSHVPETYLVEEAPAPQVVIEKRIEAPKVGTNHHVVVEKKIETPKVEVETVQHVVPVKKTSVVTTTVAEQPAFNFQKQFGFNFALGGAAQNQPSKTYVVEETAEVQTPPPQVVVEKRIEVPKVETVHKVETVQEVVPVKHKTVYAAAPVEQPTWGFQKGFGFNFGLGGGGYGQVPYQPPAPVYNPPTYVYRKHHVRPAHRRVYQYQTEVVPVVQKRKHVVVQSAPAPAPVPAAGYGGFAAQGRVDSGFFDSIFNIPIQTLKAVNGFLNTKAQAGGGIQFQKSAGFQLG